MHKRVPSRVYKKALDGHHENLLEHYKCCMAEAINPHFREEQEKNKNNSIKRISAEKCVTVRQDSSFSLLGGEIFRMKVEG